MTLSGANTYTGTTTVSGGKLNITGSKFNSRLLVNSGATAVIDVGENGVVNMSADGYSGAVMIGNSTSGNLILDSGTVTFIIPAILPQAFCWEPTGTRQAF